MKIYTRTGDSGLTGLFGGPRVAKTHARIEAYGTVDELNATVGIARAHMTRDVTARMDSFLGEIQKQLLVLGADLATPKDARVDVPRVPSDYADHLEQWIDDLEEELSPLTNFILPGGSHSAAAVHLARTVCRRAERLVTGLHEKDETSQETLIFLNRLSDFFFVASRWINMKEGVEDEIWSGS